MELPLLLKLQCDLLPESIEIANLTVQSRIGKIDIWTELSKMAPEANTPISSIPNPTGQSK